MQFSNGGAYTYLAHCLRHSKGCKSLYQDMIRLQNLSDTRWPQKHGPVPTLRKLEDELDSGREATEVLRQGLRGAGGSSKVHECFRLRA